MKIPYIPPEIIICFLYCEPVAFLVSGDVPWGDDWDDQAPGNEDETELGF